MLRLAVEEGISQIIATPHATPGREVFRLPVLQRRVQRVQAWCDEHRMPIRVYAGSEIFYTEETPRKLADGSIPTLAGSRFVLVEFSPIAPYEQLKAAVRALGNAGYDVVFAHVERYHCLRKTRHMEEMHDGFNVLMQMNASTICDKQGFFEDRWVDQALKCGMIDLVATDAHNTKERRCRMKACYDMLCQRYGKAYAQHLCIEVPTEVLSSE